MGQIRVFLPEGRRQAHRWPTEKNPWWANGLFLWILVLVGLAAVWRGLFGHQIGEPGQAWAVQTARGELQLTVLDPAAGKPATCRMHLRRSKGQPWRVEGLPFWHDHFVFPGQVLLKLPLGVYEFEIERGPEYAVRSGYFTIQRDSNDATQVELPRFVDMASEGWYAGDLLACRAAKEIDLLMEAEDLFLTVRAAIPGQKESVPAQSPAPSRTSGRRVHRPGLLVQQTGGVYLLVPLEEEDFSRILPSRLLSPSPMNKSIPLKTPALSKSASSNQGVLQGQVVALSEGELLQLLNGQGPSATDSQDRFWMDVVWPYCWDLPVWLALGKVDSVQVVHSHFRRREWVDQEKEGRPRDKARFAGRWGHGLWSQYIYFQILECGFRIPPSAGSGSGFSPNPLGYNRIYVHLEGTPSWQSWWEHFRQGQVLVTNGPLLRPSVQGKPPGHEFIAPEGQKVELELALQLSTRERVPYLEIIQNGQVAHSVPFQEFQKVGRLPKLTFERSGWFLVRAMAESPPTYRLALTGPYYVRIGAERRISRSAVEFFLTWLQEREAMAAQEGLFADPSLRKAYQTARQFWQDLRQKANAD